MSATQMKPAVGYLRVSTREQARGGLGLAAQRNEIEAFGAREGFAIRCWYQDVQTGGGADALLLRPGLAQALKEAKAARCALIVSRLDRLSERSKAALARSKRKLGMHQPCMSTKTFRRRIQAASVAAPRKAALERAEAYRVHIEWAPRQPGL